MEKFWRSNLVDRALAIFLAIALWLFVTGDNITRTTPSRKVIEGVPLEYANLEKGHAVTGLPATVDVTLEGLADTFDGLTMSEVEAYLDLSGLESGLHQVRVQGRPPRGLTLVSFSPAQVEVLIEPLHSALYPVRVEFDGTPAAGWTRQSYTCEPMQVSVEAAQSVLDSIGRVVAYVDLNGRRQSFQVTPAPVVFDLSGEEISGLEIKPARVTISVDMIHRENSAP